MSSIAVLLCFLSYSPFKMRIYKPKIIVAQQEFRPPIWGCQLIRTTSAPTRSNRHLGKLDNNITVATRYITTSCGTLLASRGAQCTKRTHNHTSTNFIPHNCSRGSRRHFSGSPRNMTAEKIDGTAIARDIRTRLQGEIKKRQETNPRYKPSLTIVQGTWLLKLGLDDTNVY